MKLLTLLGTIAITTTQCGNEPCPDWTQDKEEQFVRSIENECRRNPARCSEEDEAPIAIPAGTREIFDEFEKYKF